MVKSKQPAKRHRQSLKRRERNYDLRSRLRTYIKNAREAVNSNAEDKNEKISMACRELDRMVTKGLIKKNTASRGKSRLIKTLSSSNQ